MSLGTFRCRTFRALGSFAQRTFSGPPSHPSQRPGLQTFSCRTFAKLGNYAQETFGGLPQALGPGGTIPPIGCIPSYQPTLSFAGDELVWDNRENVSYVSVNKAGDQSYCPANCHRSAITLKELAASNGVYVPRDLVLRIPRSQLPVTPKPRDRWTDSEGQTFTVLEVGRNVGRERHRLVCRNLVIEAALDDVITVQRASISYDQSGVKQKAWYTLYSNVPARIQPQTAELVDERGVRGLKVSHECILGQVVVVTNEDRVLLNGRFYEIRGYSMPERIDELMRLELDLVP
jgi:hypothetical protein